MIGHEEMSEAIRKLLRTDFPYAEETNGIFTIEIYADYRDEMQNETAIKILKAPDPMQAFWDILNEWYTDCELSYRDELEDQLRKLLTETDGLCPGGLTDEEEDQFRDIVMELVSFSYPEDHYMNQEFYVNIMVDTGDGNYDFVLNDVYPAYCSYGEPLDNKASIVWLAKTQGYTKSQLKKALRAGDMSNPKGFLESMRVEVANLSTHMNVLTFLVKLPLQKLISLNKLIRCTELQNSAGSGSNRCGYIMLSKETETGLFDPWNGGGSCFQIELEQEIKLPIRYIRSALPDGGDGCSIERVYGMCGSAWKHGMITNVHAPKKLLSA